MLCGRNSDTHTFVGGWKPFFFFFPEATRTQTSPQTVAVNENIGFQTLASTSASVDQIGISTKLLSILNPVWAEEFEIP